MAQLSVDQLDFIIIADDHPDLYFVNLEEKQANIEPKAFAFDLTAACSGFIFALSTGEKSISGRYQRGSPPVAKRWKSVDWSDQRRQSYLVIRLGVLLEAAEKQHFFGLKVSLLMAWEVRVWLVVDLVCLRFRKASWWSLFENEEGWAISDFAIRDVVTSLSKIPLKRVHFQWRSLIFCSCISHPNFR